MYGTMQGYRWSVEVKGGSQLATLLTTHFPALATDLDAEGLLFIAHPDIEQAATPDEAREAAESVLKTLLPSLSVAATYVPPSGLGRYVREHSADGSVSRRSAFVSLEGVAMACSIMGVNVAGATPVAPPRTKAERAAALAASKTDYREAALCLHRAGDDIRQLYVVYEYVRDSVCGTPQNWMQLVHNGWATEAELVNFRNTANNKHRHKPKAMQDEMSPTAAREFIRNLMGRWVDKEVPT